MFPLLLHGLSKIYIISSSDVYYLTEALRLEVGFGLADFSFQETGVCVLWLFENKVFPYSVMFKHLEITEMMGTRVRVSPVPNTFDILPSPPCRKI